MTLSYSKQYDNDYDEVQLQLKEVLLIYSYLPETFNTFLYFQYF